MELIETEATPKVFIKTFGCQMNKLDSELILGRLLNDGYGYTDNLEDADIVLVNTCSVRAHAEDRANSWIGALKTLKKRKPNLIIGVIGCMAENYGHKLIQKHPHIQFVAGPRRLSSIPALIKKTDFNRANYGARILPEVALGDSQTFDINFYHTVLGRESAYQGYIRIMEGCDMSCSYCIVPKVRGRETSRPPEDIMREAKSLVDRGCVEITLLGQTVNSYGNRLKPKTDLAELLYRVSEIDGIQRVKFITSHPIFINNKLISAIREIRKVSRYIHLPAQSGSNRILKMMRRGYTSEKYIEIVNQLRESIPDVEIASDFIAGSPTETEDDFEKTVSLVQTARFQNIFVFKYSPREGTEAIAYGEDVFWTTKSARNNELLKIQQRISLERNKEMIGKTVEVLVEGQSKRDKTRFTGRTNTNFIVVFPGNGNNNLVGKFVNVEITGATALTLYGKIYNQG